MAACLLAVYWFSTLFHPHRGRGNDKKATLDTRSKLKPSRLLPTSVAQTTLLYNLTPVHIRAVKVIQASYILVDGTIRLSLPTFYATRVPGARHTFTEHREGAKVCT